MAGTSADDRSAESRRILDQVARETRRNGFLSLDLIPGRARDHLSAADVDQSDRIELWGTRIGRTIGALALLALLVWVLTLVASGA